MIVKNEHHVIERCLNSLKPFIDYWVIVDTGSTDGTQALIRQTLKEIPGELYERPWVDFASNREEALQLAKSSRQADYFLIMDADDYLVYEEGFALPELTRDYYYIIQRPTILRQQEVPNIRLYKSDLDWHWSRALHEKLTAPDAKTEGTIERIICMYTREGARAQDREYLRKDIEILEEMRRQEPDNPENLAYLAAAYVYIRKFKKALEMYEKRLTLRGHPDELFHVMTQIAKLQGFLHYEPSTVSESY